jgi:protein-S-isoprenylcysteine O-methyltransferase Ste14
MDLIVAVTNIVCWGIVVAAWVILGVRNIFGARDRVAPRRGGASLLLSGAAIVATCVAAVVPQPFLAAHAALDLWWVRTAGLALLVASTAFTLRARLTLGTLWSIGPRAAERIGLRTDGVYAVTRHPIYTGLLGMLTGSAAAAGFGRWLVLPAIGLIVFGLKIWDEERFLTSVYPGQYAAYRRRVPLVIPRPGRWLCRTAR